MNLLLRLGMCLVVLALASYTTSMFALIRHRRIVPNVRRFLVMGVALDLMATLCMILGSSHGPLTLHGCLGYSALLFMLVDMIWILRFESRSGREEQIPGKLLYISVAAYSWWVLAFLAGAMLAMRMPH